MSVRIRELRPDDWPAIESLFGERGACGGCWCMAWRRDSSADFKEHQGDPNRRAFRRLVEQGRAHGCLAFDGDEAVGWCSVGPRSSFPMLDRKRVYRTEWDDDTWSITCFVIKKAMRGKGLATKLAKAAAEVAFKRGARVVEGYPALANKPLPPVFAWTGVPRVFERAGFQPDPENPRVFRLNR